ncbi:MAG TPA: VWA domain-containing protein, partial [Vicinamibacteria bacterium]|nr:VWA domain-containing protein [Vicinamibacteria bacterium]
MFAARAEAVTVDVVVVDREGRPVRDLAASEFKLLEDGRPMTIVGFEPHVLTDPTEPKAAADAATTAATAATNEAGLASAGRTHVFLIDDLGIEPTHMPGVTKSIEAWLAKGALPRDELTITTTSGDVWWSDTVSAGRADFEAVLGRLRGKQRAPAIQDALTEVEAYRIDLQGPIEPDGGGAPSGPPTGASCATNSGPGNVRDRVVDRWFSTGACLCEPMSVAQSIRSCRSQVFARATEVYRGTRQRAQALLGGVERISRGLADVRGRKSLVVFSEGLLRDAQQTSFESAVDASRHGNTAVSFVDVRGLVALPIYGAEQTVEPAAGMVGIMSAETTRLATAGAEYLADATGGRMVNNSNDLAGGLARVTDESSVYYLLGYQPDRPLAGGWRRLEVQVTRPGLKVRARPGYFATAPSSPAVNAAGKDKTKKGQKGDERTARLVDPALATGGERDGIPLRVAPYVMETDGQGTARVVIAAEVDTAPLTFAGTGSERTAQLDVTVLGISRDGPGSA